MLGFKTSLVMFVAIAAALSACGHGGDRITSSNGLEGDSDESDPAIEKEGDGEPVDCTVVDCWGGKEDPGTTGPSEPLPSCADSGFACAVIIDKEILCGADLSPRWDFACGDNEVCCGTPVPEESDPGTGESGDPGDWKSGS